MKFHEFKKKISDFPVFSTSHLGNLGGNEQVLRNQLTKWQSRDLVIKLKKGLYVLGDSDRKINPSRLFLANHLYQPSYVSTEYALGFYDIIPERVSAITSVSPKKTATFENTLGRFVYQHIKPAGFRCYVLLQDENSFHVFIAEPEKALVDFLYLNSSLFKADFHGVFDSLRLQNLASLKKRMVIKYAEIFRYKRLLQIAQALVTYIQEVSK